MPDDSNVCPTCGAPQHPGADRQDLRERWELCHVRVAIVNDALIRGTECFAAIALGPSGRFVAGRSQPFRSGAAQERRAEAEGALAVLIVNLLAAGWEPWQAPVESLQDTPGHEPWYLYRFRRRVELACMDREITEQSANHTSTVAVGANGRFAALPPYKDVSPGERQGVATSEVGRKANVGDAHQMSRRKSPKPKRRRRW